MTIFERFEKSSFKTQIIIGALCIQLFIISLFTFDFILKQKENLNEHLTEEASYFATTIATATTSNV